MLLARTAGPVRKRRGEGDSNDLSYLNVKVSEFYQTGLVQDKVLFRTPRNPGQLNPLDMLTPDVRHGISEFKWPSSLP